MTTADEERELEEAAIERWNTKVSEELLPTKAQFAVGQYDDGSGPIVTVSYDTTSKYTPTMVWVETGSENWVAFDWQHADAIADAIKCAASALRSIATKDTRGGGDAE